MTRVSPTKQPFTLTEYESLDSAGKKKNLFIRLLEKFKEQEVALSSADRALKEANQRLSAMNAQSFAGNEELRTVNNTVDGLQEHNAELQTELDSIKSKWYFKLFGK